MAGLPKNDQENILIVDDEKIITDSLRMERKPLRSWERNTIGRL